MNKINRDLLVLFNQELMTPQAIEHEVELLHELLYKVEVLENIIAAHEVIDLNKYRVTDSPTVLHKLFRQKELKAFTFLNNKN